MVFFDFGNSGESQRTIKGGFLIEGSLSENVSSEFGSVVLQDLSGEILVFLNVILVLEQKLQMHVELEVKEGRPGWDGGSLSLSVDVMFYLEFMFSVLVELGASLYEVVEEVFELLFVFGGHIDDVHEVGDESVFHKELMIPLVLNMKEF